MREVYAERLSVLLESARQRLAGLAEISNVEAGLQTVGWLRAGIDEESAAKAAAAQNVEVTPLNRYSRGHVPREGFQLGFAAVDTPEIRRGIRDLAAALESMLSHEPKCLRQAALIAIFFLCRSSPLGTSWRLNQALQQVGRHREINILN